MCGEIHKKRQLNGDRAESLGKRSGAIRNALSKKAPGSVHTIAKDQKVGAGDIQRKKRLGASNISMWGEGPKTESAKKGPIYASYAPNLATVGGNFPQTSSGSKSVFGEPKSTRIKS